jgi:hypothetical protein
VRPWLFAPLLASCQLVFPLDPEPEPVGCVLVGADSDLDGVDDGCDVCPLTADAEQRDVDTDGIGDACDNCPGLASDNVDDGDRDGIGDACDNCVEIFNVDQRDTDSDQIGDVCDVCVTSADHHDEDGDGLSDPCDNCPHTPNPNQANSDLDGLGDACDNQPDLIDCIVWFDSLSTLDGWDLTTARGTWVVEGDSVVQKDVAQIQGYLASTRTFIDPFVVTRGAVLQITTAVNTQNVGVWARTTPKPLNGIDSGFLTEAVDSRDTLGGRLSVANCSEAGQCSPIEPTFPTTSTLAPLANATFLIGQDLRLAPAMSYSIQINAGTAFSSKTGFAADLAAQVAMRTNGLQARFDFYLVVERRASGGCPPR